MTDIRPIMVPMPDVPQGLDPVAANYLARLRQSMEENLRLLFRATRGAGSDEQLTYQSEVAGLAPGATIDYDVPFQKGFNWTAPGGIITWDEGTITFGGTDYTIAAGAASGTGIISMAWQEGTTSLIPHSSGFPQTDVWIIANKNTAGTHVNKAMTSSLINGGFIKANTVSANQIAANSVSTTELTVSAAADNVNAGSVQITPGQILISGGTSLSDWKHGTATTKIDGGNIHTGTVVADSIATNAITSVKIQNSAVDPAKITINAALAFDSDGRIYSGKTTYASTSAGWWLGQDNLDSNKPKFHIGSSASDFFKFDGSVSSWSQSDGTNGDWSQDAGITKWNAPGASNNSITMFYNGSAMGMITRTVADANTSLLASTGEFRCRGLSCVYSGGGSVLNTHAFYTEATSSTAHVTRIQLDHHADAGTASDDVFIILDESTSAINQAEIRNFLLESPVIGTNTHSSPTDGSLRYNSGSKILEIYHSSTWNTV